ASNASGLRASNPIRAPSRANAWAIARPKPADAPVTTTTGPDAILSPLVITVLRLLDRLLFCRGRSHQLMQRLFHRRVHFVVHGLAYALHHLFGLKLNVHILLHHTIENLLHRRSEVELLHDLLGHPLCGNINEIGHLCWLLL